MPTAATALRDMRSPARPGRFARFVLPLAGLAALGLAGCASTSSGPEMVLSATESAILAPEEAFAFPPPGGPAVISVIQRRRTNALEQEIVLGNSSSRPGQNFIKVTLFGEAPFRMAEHANFDNAFPDRGELFLEMDEVLPDVGMTVSPSFVRTKYGAFGYAMGRYSDDLCMYAWQRIGAADLELVPASTDAAITLRVRICRTGATERELLQVMYDLTITSYFSGEWEPWGTTIQALVPMTPIYPGADVLDPPVRPRVTSTAARTTTTTTAVIPAPVIVPTGPTVPLPPGANPGGGMATPGYPTGPTVPPPP